MTLNLRLMTYNVHRCVGAGGRDSLGDIAALCVEVDADLVALQELDAPETDEDEGIHHARDLAAHLGMELLFCRTFRRGAGFYGHALLSRHRLALMRATTFPSLHRFPRAEPRGAIWARVSVGRHDFDVVSTHLGLGRGEREAQSRELLGASWLESPDMILPRVVCGDLNAIPPGRTYRRFTRVLDDAQLRLRRRNPLPTWPSRLPVFRLDHVFVSPDIAVRGVRVPWNARSRRASDHLPLVVDLEIP